MLGYISRGFVTIVMERPGLPQPLKGLPALNDLKPKKRKQPRAEPQSPCKESTGQVCHSLFYLHSPCLSAHPGPSYFKIEHSHLADMLLQTHTQMNTSGFTGVIRDSRLLSPSEAYQSMLIVCLSLSFSHTNTHSCRPGA